MRSRRNWRYDLSVLPYFDYWYLKRCDKDDSFQFFLISTSLFVSFQMILSSFSSSLFRQSLSIYNGKSQIFQFFLISTFGFGFRPFLSPLSVLPYFDRNTFGLDTKRFFFQFFLISTQRHVSDGHALRFQFFLISTPLCSLRSLVGILSVLPYFDPNFTWPIAVKLSFSSSLFRQSFIPIWLARKHFQFFLISTRDCLKCSQRVKAFSSSLFRHSQRNSWDFG